MSRFLFSTVEYIQNNDGMICNVTPHYSEPVSCKVRLNISSEQEWFHASNFTNDSTHEKTRTSIMLRRRLTKRYGKNAAYWMKHVAQSLICGFIRMFPLVKKSSRTSITRRANHRNIVENCDIWFQIILVPPTFFSSASQRVDAGSELSFSGFRTPRVHKSLAAVNFQRAGRLNTFISARAPPQRHTKNKHAFPNHALSLSE
jgi:hypothetical protein